MGRLLISWAADHFVPEFVATKLNFGRKYTGLHNVHPMGFLALTGGSYDNDNITVEKCLESPPKGHNTNLRGRKQLNRTSFLFITG